MIAIVILLLVASIIPILLVAPASRGLVSGETRFLPYAHVPAIAIWASLILSGHGAQSLGNLQEVFILDAVFVAGAYIKLFLVDRYVHRPAMTSYCLAALLVLISVAFRAFMPNFPE